MEFQIVFVEDWELPGAHDWALVRTSREACFFIKESRVDPNLLLECWAAYRKASDVALAA